MAHASYGYSVSLLDRVRRAREPETREDESWANLTSGGWGNFNARQAENLSPIFACVDVISSALASLPPRLYNGPPGTDRELIANDSIIQTLETPNRYQTWPDFVSWYVAECLLYGNAVAVVRPDGELLPVRWNAVGTQMTESGELRYDWQFGEGRYNLRGEAFGESVMHMRDRTDDGVTGRSRLSRVAATVGLAHDTLDAAIAAWQNGALPSGAVLLEGRVSPDEKTRLRAQLEQQFAGAANRSRVLVLDAGSKWQALSSDLKDSEALATRQFMVAEVCRIFEVPPPIIQDYTHNTFTNAATAGAWFARFTLSAWARKFEATFKRTLLDTDQWLELDMSAFARGDLGERFAAYAVALQNGVLAPEDVKRLEGW